jgi:hypothetical protein
VLCTILIEFGVPVKLVRPGLLKLCDTVTPCINVIRNNDLSVCERADGPKLAVAGGGAACLVEYVLKKRLWHTF